MVARPRQIVRRAVMAVAVVVLLPVWYVGVWFAVSRAELDGHISSATVQRIRPAFSPLLSYCKAELPGSQFVGDIWWRANPPTTKRTVVTRNAGSQWVQYEIVSQLAPPEPLVAEDE